MLRNLARRIRSHKLLTVGTGLLALFIALNLMGVIEANDAAGSARAARHGL
jgi:hypothetical protein